MSPRTNDALAGRSYRNALLFSALGDETRLSLLTKLGERPQLSIASLAAGSSLTRQAITKHLKILETARLVRGVRRGREHLYHLEPKSLGRARDALDKISRQWDRSLARLKKFVED